MADRSGYIGRAPADSAVTVARQTFLPTGVTTDFTFASGYVSGFFDIFLNGVRMVEGSDYTSTDGSTFSILNGGAENGDVIEAVAFKAFNAATIDTAPGNLSVGGNLTVTGSASFGSVAAGTSVSFATTAYALEGTPDISVGIVTAQSGLNVIGGGATITGITTSLSGVNIVGGGLTVTGVSTFFDDVTFTGAAANITFDKSANALLFADDAEAKFGDGADLRIYHDGANSIIRDAGTGDLRVAGNVVKINNNDNTATMIKATEGSSVELNHNNSKKFETTSSGVIITGIATATTGSFSGTVTAGGISVVGNGITTAGIATFHDGADIEGFKVEDGQTAATPNGEFNFYLASGHFFRYTGTPGADYFPNFKHSASIDLNDRMDVNDVISATLAVNSPATTYHIANTIHIDGNATGENSYTIDTDWVGGSAPDAGNGSGHDVYSFTIVKTADKTFLILANALAAA